MNLLAVTRRQVIASLVAVRCPTMTSAADALGFEDAGALRKRMRALGIRRIRTPEFIIIEVKP